MSEMIPLDEDGFNWQGRDAADRQDILTNVAERRAGVHGDPDSAEKRLAVLGEIESLRAALDRTDLNAGWYARDHGATWQAIADAAGLSPDTVGTAAELVAVAREALRVPAIAELVAMQWYSAGVASFENTNLLLGDASFIGLKTGHLSATSHNLVFARKGSSGRTVVGAVLGEQSSGFARQSATQLSETALAQLESE